MNKGRLIVFSAPSGCGKGTMLAEILKDNSFHCSVSTTTRQPRTGEIDGVNYFFISKEEFEKKVQKMKAEEVERRKKEESARVKRKERDRRTEEEDEAELYTGNKQFSGGFLIGLLLLCAVVTGVLFAFPYLTQSGIF